ncbi:MAG TPA: HipA domain-containing protein [Candidatus Mediterraneibacter norfolkensis]|nr:HipA domain-containing protein [Candidatus Mediterraneibacter norfolkensis]
MNLIDFTDCHKVFGKAYNGANGKKIAVEYEGNTYMLKFPPSAEKKPTELSYTNSCYSEHIASSIFGMLGISAQETMLGTYRIADKVKVVCACKDFTADGKVLHDFCSIKNTVIDSEHGGTGTELSDIMDTLEKQEFVDPTKLTEHFWKMFVVDAFLGNFDRHNGNWGFLVDNTRRTAEIAPVFDCGSCLLPQADESVMKKVLENEDELNARIFQFPTSAIHEHGRKIRYYDFLMKGDYRECTEALLEIIPRIKIEDIKRFIENVPYLSDLQREFYQKYIEARFKKLLLPAFV